MAYSAKSGEYAVIEITTEHIHKGGLERYRKSQEHYDQTKQNYKTSKQNYKFGMATRENVRTAKSDYKLVKKQMNKNYDRLKYDKLADQGKELYRQGKRIRENEKKEAMIAAATTIGAAVITRFATQGKTISTKYGNIPLGTVAPTAVTVGGTIITGILGTKNSHTNKRLRAYYGHYS